jgi:hypothetical protein
MKEPLIGMMTNLKGLMVSINVLAVFTTIALLPSKMHVLIHRPMHNSGAALSEPIFSFCRPLPTLRMPERGPELSAHLRATNHTSGSFCAPRLYMVTGVNMCRVSVGRLSFRRGCNVKILWRVHFVLARVLE